VPLLLRFPAPIPTSPVCESACCAKAKSVGFQLRREASVGYGRWVLNAGGGPAEVATPWLLRDAGALLFLCGGERGSNSDCTDSGEKYGREGGESGSVDWRDEDDVGRLLLTDGRSLGIWGTGIPEEAINEPRLECFLRGGCCGW